MCDHGKYSMSRNSPDSCRLQFIGKVFSAKRQFCNMLHLGANEAALWDPAIKTSAKLPEFNEIRQIPARVRDERLPSSLALGVSEHCILV